MVTQYKNAEASSESFIISNNENDLKKISEDFFKKIRALSRFYANFNIGFISLAFFEILSTLLFFSFFAKTTWSAIAIAFIFLTAFSFFVIHFYFQAKKPQQFLEIKQHLQDQLSNIIKDKSGSTDHHIFLAESFIKIAHSLFEKESSFYPVSKKFKTLAPLLEKFSIWMHWKDLHKIKEILLLSAVNETVYVVKKNPMDLEAHANLATSYLSLAKIYMDPKKVCENSELLWIAPEYFSENMINKFHSASDRAIEELKILNDFAPNDPWIHKQLAKIYHDKDMPTQEIHEYEILLHIDDSSDDILFRLGVLYFEQGHNSKGLKIYQQLRIENEELAEELISNYDSFKFNDITTEAMS